MTNHIDDTVHHLDRKPRQNTPSPDFSESNGSWQDPNTVSRSAVLREAAEFARLTPVLGPRCENDRELGIFDETWRRTRDAIVARLLEEAEASIC